MTDLIYLILAGIFLITGAFAFLPHYQITKVRLLARIIGNLMILSGISILITLTPHYKFLDHFGYFPGWSGVDCQSDFSEESRLLECQVEVSEQKIAKAIRDLNCFEHFILTADSYSNNIDQVLNAPDYEHFFRGTCQRPPLDFHYQYYSNGVLAIKSLPAQ
jgi:hypothetical protein